MLLPELATPITISLAELKGKTEAQVTQILADKKLVLDKRDGVAAPSVAEAGTAYLINPEGTVSKNSVIAVTFYTAYVPPPLPAPATPTVDPVEEAYQAGDTVTINWAQYTSCPSGTRSGYTFTFTNGTGTSTVGPDQTQLPLKLGTTGPTTVNFTVQCGTQSSPQSGTLTLTVE